MNNKNLKIFIAIAVFIIIIPFYSIFENIAAVSFGNEYKFRVNGIDPYDIVRGKYVSIRFTDNMVERNRALENSKCYVTIINGEDGYARFGEVSDKEPTEGDYYYTQMDNIGIKEFTGIQKVWINTPTAYYMNENKSLSAEKIIRENSGNAYVKVKVHRGKMIITGLYVNDKLIDEIV